MCVVQVIGCPGMVLGTGYRTSAGWLTSRPKRAPNMSLLGVCQVLLFTVARMAPEIWGSRVTVRSRLALLFSRVSMMMHTQMINVQHYTFIYTALKANEKDLLESSKNVT